MASWVDDVEAYLVSVSTPLSAGDRVTLGTTGVTGKIVSRSGDNVYKVYWGVSDAGERHTYEARDDLVPIEMLQV